MVPGISPPEPQPQEQSLLQLERHREMFSPPFSDNLWLAVGSGGSQPRGEKAPTQQAVGFHGPSDS